MKLICAIVKPFKVPELVDAYTQAGAFPGMTVLPCKGFGRERRQVTRAMAKIESDDFTEHSLILIAATNEATPALVDRLARVAHTGQPGDGKLFVLELDEAIALTTRERGEAALR